MKDNSPDLGALFEIEAQSMVYGGDALGRLPGGPVVFVPYALPGEWLRVRVRERQPGYVRAEPVEVLRPSGERQLPRCRHFGDCGGCQYQHAAYPLQLEIKNGILKEQLVRLGGFAEPPMEQPLPSPASWEYRNHLQFHLSTEGRLGFLARGSGRVVSLEECHLPEPFLGALWPSLSQMFSTPGRRRDFPGLRRVILRLGVGGRRLVLLESRPGAPPPRPVAGRLPVQLEGSAVWWHRPEGGRGWRGRPSEPAVGPVRLAGDPALEMRVLGESFQVSPRSFFQVNTRAAESVVRQLLAWCGEGRREHVLELYAGVGLFSRFLASRAARLTAVESSPSACADFRANLAPEGGLAPARPGARGMPEGEHRTEIRLIEAEAAQAFPAIQSAAPSAPDLVVADPPRAGLGPEVVRGLTRLRPGRLIYVSCDPATLGRDAALLRREGWSLQRVRLVDLFPQTAHLESVSLWHAPAPRGRIEG